MSDQPSRPHVGPHRIGVIGGDGIGPEVIAEALKVVEAVGVDLRDGRLRPGRGPLRPRRRGAHRRDRRRVAWARRAPARRGGNPRGAAGRDRAGPAAQDALRPGPLHQPAAVPRARDARAAGGGQGARAPGIGQAGPRLHRDPGEHRGHLRRGGRVPAQGDPSRGGHPGLGQHPDGGRALRPLRLRAGPEPSPPTPHPGAQDQRAHLRGRPLGADLRRGGDRVPGCHHGLQPRRRRLHLLRPVARAATT